MHRRTLLTGLAAGAVVAPPVLAADPEPDRLGFRPDPVFLEKAVALLKAHQAIDTHAHPGATMRRGLAPNAAAAEAGAYEARAVADMREGLLAASSFAAVAD